MNDDMRSVEASLADWAADQRAHALQWDEIRAVISLCDPAITTSSPTPVQWWQPMLQLHRWIRPLQLPSNHPAWQARWLRMNANVWGWSDEERATRGS